MFSSHFSLVSEPELHNACVIILGDEFGDPQVTLALLESDGFTNAHFFADMAAVIELISEREPDLILLDFEGTGDVEVQLLNELRISSFEGGYVPVVVLNRVRAESKKLAVLAAGATDCLEAPVDDREVILRLKSLLRARIQWGRLVQQKRELEARVRDRTEELELTQIEIIQRLGMVTEFRDDDTGAHTARVGSLSARIALAMGQSPESADALSVAATLHDVGKVAIPDAILLKPGKLDPQEVELMKQHTVVGAQLLGGSRSSLLSLAQEIASAHHERWDGSGYPYGLKESEIPLNARIVSVADVYDALTSERPYKSAWTPQDAIKEIQRMAGTQFDPEVVKAFVAVIEADQLPSFSQAA